MFKSAENFDKDISNWDGKLSFSLSFLPSLLVLLLKVLLPLLWDCGLFHNFCSPPFLCCSDTSQGYGIHVP